MGDPTAQLEALQMPLLCGVAVTELRAHVILSAKSRLYTVRVPALLGGLAKTFGKFLPIMQCTHQSRNGTCVASCSSLPLVGLFLGPALTRQSGAANSSSPSISFPSSSDVPSRSSSISFNSTSIPLFHFLSSHLCTILPALQSCRKRLDHSLSLPAENRTCLIKANPRVHRVHTVAHSLFHPKCFGCEDFFIQHRSVSSSDDLLH